jgi:multidrug efflux pump subunit AcrA (membrane-fusion protein)
MLTRSQFELKLAAAAIAALFGAAAFDLSAARASDPVLTGCLVKAQDDVKLAGKEAGVLVQLSVKEGSQVRAADVMGKIDDSQPKLQKEAAQFAYNGAYKKWKDDVEIRYSKSAAEVAHADYDLLVETNRLSEKSVAQVEVRKAKLDWDRSVLAIEKAEHDQELAMYEASSKQAELKAADLAIDRRSLRAPFNGEVVAINRHQEEWVGAGDWILRLMRLDAMTVDGALDRTQYDPHEIAGCTVTIEVEMARGRKEQAEGRIVYVSSEVRGDGKYQVRAEVPNREDHGRWLLADGMKATMTIHLNTGGGASPVDVSRRN